MKKYLIIIGLFLLTSMNVAKAHSSAIATYQFKQDTNNDWSLTINFPLGAMHLALLKHYKEEDLWKSPGEYNLELLNDYLINHSKIAANNTIELGLKVVRSVLDNHQSQFIVAITNMPPRVQQLSFDIDAMSENEGHINIAKLNTRGRKQHIILQYSNDYRGELMLSNKPNAKRVAS